MDEFFQICVCAIEAVILQFSNEVDYFSQIHGIFVAESQEFHRFWTENGVSKNSVVCVIFRSLARFSGRMQRSCSWIQQ